MLGDSRADCSADTLEQCGYTDPGTASQSLVAACPSTCDVCSKEVKLAQRKSRSHCELKAEDEKVSIDELCEQIQEFEDYVQSVDISSMSKI